MPATDRKQILADFIQKVWNEGDAEAADEYIAPCYTIFHDPGDPWDKRELDLEGYKERVLISRAPFPDQRFDIQALIEEGKDVVMSWFWKATHQGDLPGFPATDKEITMSGITVYSFDDDRRITGHWQVTDRLGIYQQLRAARSQ